jgi:hypothetical protein
MQTKGYLVRQGSDVNRINLTAMESLAATCE